MNLSSVFPFFFFVKPSWPGPLPWAPLATSQRHYPVASVHSLPSFLPCSDIMGAQPWTQVSFSAQGPTASFSTPDFKTSFASSFCLSLVQGEPVRDYSLTPTLPLVFSPNQDSWAKNKEIVFQVCSSQRP